MVKHSKRDLKGLKKDVGKRKVRCACFIKRATKLGWKALDAVTSWQGRGLDVEPT